MMEDKTPPAQPASKCGPPTFPETEASERNHHEDLRLKDPRALDWWLYRVAALICSGQDQKAGQAYGDHALSCGLREHLERAVLIHDIGASTPSVRKRLAQNIVFLFLNLEHNHGSDDAQPCLKSNQEKLLESLQLSLQIQVGEAPERTKLDKTQITSIIRGLVEGSGGRVDVLQHNFGEEYTASENADLCASLLDITRTNQFGDFNREAMCNTLLKSPVFSEMKISVQDLEGWTTKMMDCLCLGFEKGYLDLPTQVLSGLGFGQVDQFNIYLANTYLTFPVLQTPGTSALLLLTWSTMVSGRPIEVLSEWARSRDGWSLYNQLATDFQISHGVEQLALIMAALMSYRRLLPDVSDHSDQPIKGSFLADLDVLLDGQPLGNSGAVTEQMVFSLVRVLRSFGDQFEDIITFLETILDRYPPLLHAFDGFSDQYLRSRISTRPHETALVGLSQIEMPELREGVDSNWVTVKHLDALSLQNFSQSPTETIPPPPETKSSTEQPQGGSPLQIAVTDTVGLSTAADYYAHPLSLVPTCREYLRCEKDAICVLEACLRGELSHSCRGPRDGEAVISGNIFVWETNSTGIDHWKDGRGWASHEADGFEVGEAIDGSRLMKKTISIRTSRAVHHVVCYYTAGDKHLEAWCTCLT